MLNTLLYVILIIIVVIVIIVLLQVLVGLFLVLPTAAEGSCKYKIACLNESDSDSEVACSYPKEWEC